MVREVMRRPRERKRGELVIEVKSANYGSSWSKQSQSVNADKVSKAYDLLFDHFKKLDEKVIGEAAREYGTLQWREVWDKCVWISIKCHDKTSLESILLHINNNELHKKMRQSLDQPIPDECKSIDVIFDIVIQMWEYRTCLLEFETGEIPKCVPLCYPNNYKWDKAEGKLVETKNTLRGQLVVCEDALDILRSIDGPICPVAVTGPARTGKSYIASQLIEPRPDECVFQMSSKMKSQTMGVWMSTDTFKRTLDNGTEVTVVILDTEGIDAYDAHKEDDMLMFALMALMSSILVYNKKGVISAEDINKLSWVCKLTDVFRGKREGCESKSLQEDEFTRFFPNFMWLLRDVSMTCTITRNGEDEVVGLKRYILEEVLKLEEENARTSVKIKENNATRKVLLKSFPEFDAVQLPVPSQESHLLNEMDKAENRAKLNPAFLKEVDVFIERCRSLMKPKKAWPYVGNINGRQFANMIEQYVSGFTTTKSIDVHAVVTSVIEALLMDVAEEAFANYCKSIDEYEKAAFPCETHEIIRKHNDYLFSAMRKFKENSKFINDAERLHKYKQELKAKSVQYSEDGRTCVGGYLYEKLQRNEEMSGKFCRDLVKTLITEETGHKRLPQVVSRTKHISEKYMERARGPQKLQVYKTSLTKMIEETSSHQNVDVEAGKINKDASKTNISEKNVEHLSEDLATLKITKEENEEEIRSMKAEEEEQMRKIINEDIADQQDQAHKDYVETSTAIKNQIETIHRTHEDVAKELQLLNAKLEEENKRLKEELNRKRIPMIG